MIKWLCNKIVQWGQDYEKYDEEEVYITASSKTGRRKGTRAVPISDSEVFNIPKTFRFDVSVGRGGVVLITRRYDAKKDETIEILNVIHDDQDISAQVGQIVAMEMIKS
jgi:uncharacterized protein YrzB (UPF0473 family)